MSCIRTWLASRPQFDTYHSLFHELKKKDGKPFKEFVRTDEIQSKFLVDKLTTEIIKEDTTMRPCIKPHETVCVKKPHEMVCVALCYLASGKSFTSLHFQLFNFY